MYTAELDDFTNCIYGSSEYLHPYGDPLDCHHFDTDDRKTEPTVDKDINVRSKDEPKTQTETQNSNLTFEKDECAKEYEELGLKELKELIEADRKTEPQSNADQRIQDVESVEPMQTERDGE